MTKVGRNKLEDTNPFSKGSCILIFMPKRTGHSLAAGSITEEEKIRLLIVIVILFVKKWKSHHYMKFTDVFKLINLLEDQTAKKGLPSIGIYAKF